MSLFFFNATAPSEIYTLSLHDALPIFSTRNSPEAVIDSVRAVVRDVNPRQAIFGVKLMDQVVAESMADFTLRSEEHTSELQSQSNLVCRLLLEKKKKDLAGLHCQASKI